MKISDKGFFLNIAGVTIKVDSSVDIESFTDIDFYKKFFIEDPDKYDCSLSVKMQAPPALSGDRAFSPHNNWRISDTPGKKVIEVGPPPKTGGPRNLTVLDKDYSRGDVYYRAANEIFSGFLAQFLIVNILSRQSGFLLHSSGLVLDGRAMAFVGPSGVGKSTMLKLFRDEVEERYLLNDDRLALRRESGRWRVFGTPWHGELPFTSTISADLGTLFFIKQAKHNYSTRLSPGDALQRLVSQVVIPLWDEDLSARVLDSFHDLIANVPAFELGFLPDKSAVEFIKSVI